MPLTEHITLAIAEAEKANRWRNVWMWAARTDKWGIARKAQQAVAQHEAMAASDLLAHRDEVERAGYEATL